MIRKQLYVSTAHDRKLKELARRWECSEAEVVRRALDRLPADEDSTNERILQVLEAAHVLEHPTPDPRLPKGADERRRLREQLELELEAQDRPLGLSEAVLEDRR